MRARFAGEELPDGWGQDALREVLEEAERDGVLTFPADEPLFLLRGQDGIAAEAVSFLRAPGAVPPRVRRPPPSEQFVGDVSEAYQAFKRWQIENPDRVKTPD